MFAREIRVYCIRLLHTFDGRYFIYAFDYAGNSILWSAAFAKLV